jgi:hypothetical protein
MVGERRPPARAADTGETLSLIIGRRGEHVRMPPAWCSVETALD